VLEVEAPVSPEFVHDDFAVLPGTEEDLLLASAPSSDICTVKDIHHVLANNNFNRTHSYCSYCDYPLGSHGLDI